MALVYNGEIMSINTINRIILVIFSLTNILFLVFGNSASVYGLSEEQKRILDSGIYFFEPDPNISNFCSTLVAESSDIFNDAQLQQISLNRSFYETAANESNIPWQMIAVIHKNETNLSRDNPSNGQGIYQFVNKGGGPYPTGPVTDEEFLRQTKLAAEFIRGKLSSNLSSNRVLSSTGGTPETIKDTFFSYNGRAKVYAEQAESLGFDKATQPYEGSPYVMNKADPQRDPTVNQTSWGQIKTDGGGIQYPANDFYGAFVQYSALSGSSASNCDLGLSLKVVEIAKQELSAGAKESDGSYLKYTGGREVDWCAYFVSWVFEQAGKPLEGGPYPAVSGMRDYAKERGLYFEKSDTSFTPMPGDIVVFKEGLDPYPSHVNLVITYDSATNTLTTIGGNENDKIMQANINGNLPAISGFIRIRQ